MPVDVIGLQFFRQPSMATVGGARKDRLFYCDGRTSVELVGHVPVALQKCRQDQNVPQSMRRYTSFLSGWSVRLVEIRVSLLRRLQVD